MDWTISSSIVRYELFQEVEIIVKNDLSNGEIKKGIDFKILCHKFRDIDKENFQFLTYNPYLTIDEDIVQSILKETQLELLYLPNHGQYCVIKNEYTPPLEKINMIIEKEGGITINRLIEAIKCNSKEAEVIVQSLLRRRMGVLTYSYLKGERFFFR
jgi:hypothetical protein